METDDSTALPSPFTITDVRQAVRLEKEEKTVANGWTFLREGNRPGLGEAVKLYYTTNPSKLLDPTWPELQTLLHWTSAPMPAKEAAFLLINAEVRQKWDTFIPPIVISADKHRPRYVFGWSLPTPWPLQRRLVVHDVACFECDGAYVVLYKGKNGDDFDKPSARFPQTAVRARCGLTFTVVRPNTEQPETHCDVVSVTNNDYGGVIKWLPYWVTARLGVNGLERAFQHMNEKATGVDLDGLISDFSPWEVNL